jgi:hypothetical protein
MVTEVVPVDTVPQPEPLVTEQLYELLLVKAGAV